MNFYQELQLNQAGSKSYIASFKNPKDKCKHIAVYLFKIALVVAFCVSFVTLFSVLFGNENSIAGVVVLLCRAHLPVACNTRLPFRTDRKSVV